VGLNPPGHPRDQNSAAATLLESQGVFGLEVLSYMNLSLDPSLPNSRSLPIKGFKCQPHPDERSSGQGKVDTREGHAGGGETSERGLESIKCHGPER